MNSVIVNYSKDDITKFTKKLKKMKKKENDKDLELKKNVELELSIEINLDKLKRNNKEIKDTQKLINEIKENDYPFNPNCECCMKQPWKIQLNNLEEKLEGLNEIKLTIQNDIDNIIDVDNVDNVECKSKILEYLENVKKKIEDSNKWFNNFNELKKNENTFNKQLKLLTKKEELQIKRDTNESELTKINQEIDVIIKNLETINIKLEYETWIKRKEQSTKDYKSYELYCKEKLEEWNEIQKYQEYINNFIKDYNEYNKNIDKLDYWKKIKDIKPEWIDIENKKKDVNKKRKYLLNITNKYQSLKSSYDVYVKECKNLKNYKKILLDIEKKNKGVEVLSELFNNFRLWLYKEKLFPLILKKINLIIGNMSKNNEKLELDIVWNDEVFNWFIIHNDNKIIINKASGFQKFIIDLSMRITLSSIGVSSLKCNQLFIDEGFSSCDNFHLEKIPIFLNSLLDIYKSVLVVSHINEIQNSTSNSYNIKRESNLSIINYGDDNRKNIKEMIEIVNGLKKLNKK